MHEVATNQRRDGMEKRARKYDRATDWRLEDEGQAKQQDGAMSNADMPVLRMGTWARMLRDWDFLAIGLETFFLVPMIWGL
jgi:hypothetical protein